MKNIERLSEFEWRRHVARELDEVNAQLLAGQKSFLAIQGSIKAIEHNTSLARNVQQFSNATSLVYRTLATCAKPMLRTLLWGVAAAIFVYMVTHGGQLPTWSKPWLIFMEKTL